MSKFCVMVMVSYSKLNLLGASCQKYTYRQSKIYSKGFHLAGYFILLFVYDPDTFKYFVVILLNRFVIPLVLLLNRHIIQYNAGFFCLYVFLFLNIQRKTIFNFSLVLLQYNKVFLCITYFWT